VRYFSQIIDKEKNEMFYNAFNLILLSTLIIQSQRFTPLTSLKLYSYVSFKYLDYPETHIFFMNLYNLK